MIGLESAPVVMGVTILEVPGYQVDTEHHRLVREDMLLLST